MLTWLTIQFQVSYQAPWHKSHNCHYSQRSQSKSVLYSYSIMCMVLSKGIIKYSILFPLITSYLFSTIIHNKLVIIIMYYDFLLPWIPIQFSYAMIYNMNGVWCKIFPLCKSLYVVVCIGFNIICLA